MKKDYFIEGLILLVVVALGAFFLFSRNAPDLAYGSVEIPGSVLMATAPSSEAVDITATTMKPGFITIHESIGSAPGPIIGSSGYLDVQENKNFIIFTSQGMNPATPYIALLHVDNGDGRFVITDDMPVTSNGASVRADFTSP